MLTERNYRNIAINIVAMLAPMVAGVLVVPDLIRHLGPQRFGVLSMSWVLVGYFGVLDLGLARGLTQYIAKLKGAGTAIHIRAGVAVLVRRRLLVLGLVWAVILGAATPWLAGDALGISVDLQREAAWGWAVLALSVPALMWSSCSVGLLEANERFSALNAVRIPMGAAIFLMPWAVAQVDVHLGWVIGSICAVRWIGAMLLASLCSRDFGDPELVVARTHLPEITRFGGWLTISNVVGPFLAYFDRFAIAGLISVTAVTYYTVPFDVLARLPVLPLAMMGVLFPMLAVANASVNRNSDDTARMMGSARQLLVAFWLPGMWACGALGTDFLNRWVGQEVASQSLVVWHWIAVGVLVNGFAHLPYALLHSAGRTDITARIHMMEFFPYLAALWWAIEHFGIAGAAAVWTLRVIVDTLALYGVASRLIPQLREECGYAMAWAFGGGVLLAAFIGFEQEIRAGIASTLQFVVLLLLSGLLWSGWRMRKIWSSLR